MDPEKLKQLQARARAATEGKKLGGSSADTINQLLGRMQGGTETSRRLLSEGKHEEAAHEEEKSTVLEVYFVSDATGSMFNTISEVRDHVGALGDTIFRDGAYTRVSVVAFYDHGSDEVLGVNMAPLTPLTQSKTEMTHALESQLVDLTDDDPHLNQDWVENGECALKEVVNAIRRSDVEPHPEYEGKTVKRVIVYCMETPMHGQLDALATDVENPRLNEIIRKFSLDDIHAQIKTHDDALYNWGWDDSKPMQRAMAPHMRDAPAALVRRVLQYFADNHDKGCYKNVNWKTTLDAAKRYSSMKGGQFYLVDCEGHFGNEIWSQVAKQICIDPEKPGEHYVKLGGMTQAMPKLLGGLIESGRGLASAIQYVAKVEREDGSHAAAQVQKLLPAGGQIAAYRGGTPQGGQ